MTSKPAYISLQGVQKKFGSHMALQDINLDIQEGSVVVIIGPSGSGKSTLIRCMNGLVRPDSGLLAVGGEEVDILSESAWQKMRMAVGMVFQDYSLFPHLSILQNMTLVPRRRLKLKKKVAEQEARTLLERVGLLSKIHDYPSSLSGGQQQRIAIVRALAMRPTALLFDEPTSALDPETISSVLDVMRELAQAGKTMVIVTHEMGFAREVADQIIFMADGRIVESGSPQEIFTNPRHDRTRSFLSSVSRL